MPQPDNGQTSPDAAFARRLFGTEEPDVNLGAALQSVVTRAQSHRSGWRTSAGFAVAAAFLAALLLTPLSGYAVGLLTIFEPKAFVPIAISPQDAEQMRLMPSLASLGTLTATSHRRLREVGSAAAARLAAGFTPRRETNPQLMPLRPVKYFVLQAGTVTFTFSAAKARAYERRFHRRLPPMPAGLDGTAIQLHLGTGIVTAYGPLTNSIGSRHRSQLADGVAIAQMKTPRITSDGASIETLENYVLSMPNVPADVAAQLRTIASPSGSMPIPLRIDKTNAKGVVVDGTHGLAIGDQTGLGSEILWQKDGMIYAVGGSLKMSDAMALADALR